jgi:hypothetical protein
MFRATNEVRSMKREYSRPSIHVEPMKLDTAIASTNCTIRKEDLNALRRWGYFAPELVCGIVADNLGFSLGIINRKTPTQFISAHFG